MSKIVLKVLLGQATRGERSAVQAIGKATRGERSAVARGKATRGERSAVAI